MALDFPALRPARRTFSFGDWPVKAFKAQNGSEVRVMYGNRRTGMTMTLEWQNLESSDAEKIFDHYVDKQGSYQGWSFGSGGSQVRTGWTGTAAVLEAAPTGNVWRYVEPPTLETVMPNVHNVSIKVIAVL